MKKGYLYGLFGLTVLVCIASLVYILSPNRTEDKCGATLEEGKFDIINTDSTFNFTPLTPGEYRVALDLISDKPVDFGRLLTGKAGSYNIRVNVYNGGAVIAIGRFNPVSPISSVVYDENTCTIYLATFDTIEGETYPVELDVFSGSREFNAIEDMNKVLRVERLTQECTIPAASGLLNYAMALFVLSAVGMIVLGLKIRKA